MRRVAAPQTSRRALFAEGGGHVTYDAFEQLLDSWYPLAYMLNNLNRGLPDAYPFVLSTPAIDKSRFVHDVIDRYTLGNRT